MNRRHHHLAAALPLVTLVASALAQDAIPPKPSSLSREVTTPAGTFAAAAERAFHRTVKLYGAGIAFEHGYASGVIVSPDGEVMTALSIILDATTLRAVTWDGRVFPAQVTYRDEERQLALLTLARTPDNVTASSSNARPATLEAYTPREFPPIQPGDWILTVGNPFKVAEGDEQMSIMKGVISGRTQLDAQHGSSEFPYHGPVLLIDAITGGPGSAGSAVVDIDGRLVGMVGRPLTSRMTNTLLNYAYPAEELAAFLKQSHEPRTPASQPAAAPAITGYHGIVLSKIAYHRDLPFVRSVAEDSPARAAGVKADDLIVSANGMAIPRGRAFTELCERLHAGDELSLVVKRGEQLLPIRFKLTRPPAEAK